jgi:hypothetical protein
MRIILSLLILISVSNAEYIRDNLKQTVTDTQKNLMWQDNSNVGKITKNYKEALLYCKKMTFASFSDWVLPTQKELNSLVDKNKKHPAIKNIFKNIVSNAYCSSSYDKTKELYAKVVHFCNGHVYSYEKTNLSYVRCIRKIKIK